VWVVLVLVVCHYGPQESTLSDGFGTLKPCHWFYMAMEICSGLTIVTEGSCQAYVVSHASANKTWNIVQSNGELPSILVECGLSVDGHCLLLK